MGTRINISGKYIWKIDKVDVLWKHKSWLYINAIKNIPHKFVRHKINNM